MDPTGIERRREQNLVYNFLRVVELAAIEAARTMGQGERKYSDQVAVEKMRAEMDMIPMDGRISLLEKANATKRRCSTSANGLA
ncbi:MAG: fructose-bisphosphatase class II [Blastocatellia bacterium]